MRLQPLLMSWQTILGGTLGLAGSLVYSHNLPQQSQPEKPIPAPAQPAEQVAKYLGADACQLCHEDGPRGRFKNDFCWLTEYKTWKTDKHSQAYEMLRNPRSQQMAALLNIPDATKDARCLNCHAANVPPQLRNEVEGQAYKIEDGVSCDACHGPSSLWLTPHFTEPGWRTKPAADKKKLGFIDVRAPAERSQMCLSCHLGNVAEGKLLTHDMYAAGHPPLPSFEATTFGDRMPRHWRTMKEKGPKICAQFHFDPDKNLELTRLTIISGAAAFRAAMNLLAGQAQKGPQESAWPELAQFDCYACHHDLKNDSWRQKRGYSGTPGRPQMRPWPIELAQLGAGYAGEDPGRLSQARNTLTTAFSVQPFGDRNQVTTAARDIATWSNGLVDALAGKNYDQASARRLLRSLCALAQQQVPDYDSARQIAWAFRIIYRDVEPKPNDAEIQKTLKSLDTELKLDLPAGTQRVVLRELAEQLQKIREYNPYRFQRLMTDLSKQLPQD